MFLTSGALLILEGLSPARQSQLLDVVNDLLLRMLGKYKPTDPKLTLQSLLHWAPHTTGLGFPGGSAVKNLPASAGDASAIPGSGRPHGGGNGSPLSYSSLENPMDTRVWWAAVHGLTKSRTQLRDQTATTKHARPLSPALIAPRARTPVRVTPHPEPVGVAQASQSEACCPASLVPSWGAKAPAHVPLSPSAPTTPGASPVWPPPPGNCEQQVDSSMTLVSQCVGLQFPSVQSLSHIQLFATPWTAAHQASLSISSSRSLLKLTSVLILSQTFYEKANALVAQSCPTHCNPMDRSPPGFSVHEILQARNTGVGSHSLLQGIFPTQGSNPSVLHCRQILHHLSYQGSPSVL